MRKNIVFWLWTAMFAVILVIATQPVGLNAQFAFGLFGVGFMLVVRLAKLRGEARAR